MKRTCPFCKSELHKNDIYFCSGCGSLLPSELQLKDFFQKNAHVVKHKTNSNHEAKEVVKKPQPKIITPTHLKFFLILIVVLVGILVCFYFLTQSVFSRKWENEQLKQSSQSISEVNNRTDDKNSVTLENSIIPGPIIVNNAAEFVPYDVDLYGNFNSIELVENYFGYLGIGFSSFIADNSEYISSNYSFFGKNFEGINNLVFIFFPTKQDISIKDYAGWKIQKVSGALVVSENQFLINEVESSKKGLTKSLGLNSNFITMKKNIPVEGKAFLMTFNNTGGEILDSILAKTSSNELKLIVESFKKLDSNYLIVK